MSAPHWSVAALIVRDQYLYTLAAQSIRRAGKEVREAEVISRSLFGACAMHSS
jgi:hypothetical protein